MPTPGPVPYNRLPMRTPTLLVAALLLLGPLSLPPGALAAGATLSEKATEDTTVGYSLHAIRGWEPMPRKNPDDPTARSLVGGWYSKEKDARGAQCIVLAFGSYYPEQSQAVPTEEDAPLEPGAPGDGGGEGPAPAPGGEPGPEPEPGKESGGEPAKPAPRRPTSLREMFGTGPASFEEWVKAQQAALQRGGSRMELTPVKARLGDDEGFLYEGTLRRSSGEVLNLMAASVKRGSLEVAVLYQAADDKYYVRDYRGAFRGSVKSLRILSDRQMDRAREALAKRIAEAGGEDAAWAERVVAALPPGWTHHRTDNYCIVYDRSIDAPPPKGVPGLVPRIGRQLEALRRDLYEPLFPADRPVTAISVVKVTQDPKQYLSYGAPPGSAGYWSWPSRELVFFCKSDNYDMTLDVLNHEAFHQYIFYAVGQVSPHSWFNEGHGDYFAGFDLFEGKFRPGKFHWRTKRIQRAIEAGTHVPLDKFLKFSQAEYYRRGGDPRKGEDVGQNYAQGWSLVWFLRTTKDPRYAGILDRYFTTLKAAVTRWREEEEALAAKEKRRPLPTFLFPPERNAKAMEDALAAGFDGVDLKQLEKDWIDSKPY